MKIVIAKNHTGLYNIFLVNGSENDLQIDIIDFKDLPEQEAKCRADSLKSVLCCPIVTGECDDYLLVPDDAESWGGSPDGFGWAPFPFPSIRKVV
jgi:hypothetical protein